VGTPLEGNRLIRKDVISLKRQVQRAEASSLLTSVMQLPWKPVLGRLRPAATVQSKREQAG